MKTKREILLEQVPPEFRSVFSYYAYDKGHYYHEFSTTFDFNITDNEGDEIDTKKAANAQDYMIELARDLMKWIYRALEREYEFQNSDENIIETIKANEYIFDEDGDMI